METAQCLSHRKLRFLVICDKKVSHCDVFKTVLHALKAPVYGGLRGICDKSAKI